MLRLRSVLKAIAAGLVPLAVLLADLAGQASGTLDDGVIVTDEWKLLVLSVLSLVGVYLAPKNRETPA